MGNHHIKINNGHVHVWAHVYGQWHHQELATAGTNNVVATFSPVGSGQLLHAPVERFVAQCTGGRNGAVHWHEFRISTDDFRGYHIAPATVLGPQFNADAANGHPPDRFLQQPHAHDLAQIRLHPAGDQQAAEAIRQTVNPAGSSHRSPSDHRDAHPKPVESDHHAGSGSSDYKHDDPDFDDDYS